jgi:DNA topoisomerase VI subunit B
MGNQILTRTTFEMSREREYFTEQELQLQIGFSPRYWAIALTKELLDNSLDASEAAGVRPTITLTHAGQRWTVQDNGCGLPQTTLERSLDYRVRVSDKAYYVSPSRGQLGNALKCVWAAPYVLSPHGKAQVMVETGSPETGSRQYLIDVQLDPLAQAPKRTLIVQEGGTIKTGTAITITWPDKASSVWGYAPPLFYHPRALLQAYALFNPHASFTYAGAGAEPHTWPAAQADWTHWTPTRPTASHWYTPARFQQLLAGYLVADREAGRRRTVREVIAEFDGLSGVQARQAVALEAGLHRAILEDLVDGRDTLDTAAVARLLTAMQARAREVKPQALGVLGQAHLTQMLTEAYGVDPATLTYRCQKGVVEGLPYVLEVACGWPADAEEGTGVRLYGYNHAPALKTPFPQLEALCDQVEIDASDPVTLLVHLTCPRLDATDRGKTAVTLPAAITEALETQVERVTKRWTVLKRKLRQEGRRALREDQERRKQRAMTVKEAAWQVMEDAYLKASDQGRLPANARQIMYAARPLIIQRTGKAQPWAKSSYFTQTLLPEFMREYPDLTADWDVIFDARGHFREPHTRHFFGIGTLEVRQYLAAWRRTLVRDLDTVEIPHRLTTVGPAHRYRYALFVEKEGFNPLLERAQIEERFDVALMSTKGMTVTAARALVEALSQAGVTILVVHDFDKSGLEILDKFSADTRRYQYTARPNVIDLGLRLEEALAMGLEREQVPYGKGTDPRQSLRRCGATEAECTFLVHDRPWYHEEEPWEGERIELNAMTSAQFVRWLEDGLRAAGVTKLVPDADTLAQAYAHQRRIRRLQHALERALDEEPATREEPPADLATRVRERITETDKPWDEGLWEIVRTQREAEEEDADA